MYNLLLSKEELNKIKSSKLFHQWLYGLIDEKKLTEEENKIIYAYQVYYDLVLGDNFIYNVLDDFHCYGIDDLINNDKKIRTIAGVYNLSEENIRIQALLTLKRQEREKEKSTLTRRKNDHS